MDKNTSLETQLESVASGELQPVKDEIAEKLDELADLSEHWKKNREKGIHPQAIRSALIQIIQHVEFLAYTQQSRVINNDWCKTLGEARTVGELRQLLEKYPNETSFGFRNQPMQWLYEVKRKDSVGIVFQ